MNGVTGAMIGIIGITNGISGIEIGIIGTKIHAMNPLEFAAEGAGEDGRAERLDLPQGGTAGGCDAAFVGHQAIEAADDLMLLCDIANRYRNFLYFFQRQSGNRISCNTRQYFPFQIRIIECIFQIPCKQFLFVRTQ